MNELIQVAERQIGDGTIQTVNVRHPEGLPLNARELLKPTEARPVKSNLYEGIDYTDRSSFKAREVVAEAAARSIRKQIEAIDPTGTIAQKNRAAGKYLAAERGFMRSMTRDANRQEKGFLQKIGALPAKGTPASIRNLNRLELLYSALGRLQSPAVADAVRVPILAGRHAAGALPPDLDPEALFPVRRDSSRSHR